VLQGLSCNRVSVAASRATSSYFRNSPIYADIWVRERLLPRGMKSSTSFYEKDYSFREDVSLRHPETLRPGSKSFIEAMDRADAIRRHYLRLLMVLQGLVDRTLLLAPFPRDQRPNLLDPDSWGDQIRFVRDAEDVVTDGRPTFRECSAR